MRACAALALAVAVFGCAGSGEKGRPAAGDVTVELTGSGKGGDRIEAGSREGAVILDVYSESGIGRAAVSPGPQGWPSGLVFRLHLRGLESFSVQFGEFHLDSSVLSRAPYGQACEFQGGRGPDGTTRVTEASPYWMSAVMVTEDDASRNIPLEEGYFEVTVPRAVLKRDPEMLRVQWIDFYR